jgi:hypothetical protein
MTGTALLAMEKRDAALHEAQQESMDGAKLFTLAVIYYSMGQRADSDAALAQLTRDAANRAWRHRSHMSMHIAVRTTRRSSGSSGHTAKRTRACRTSRSTRSF